MTHSVWQALTLCAGRFHDIAWGRSNDEYSRGIIAGALENGALDLWNGGKLMTGTRSGLT